MLLVGDRIPAGLSRMVQLNIFAIRAQPLRLPIFPASFLKRCAVRKLNLHELSDGVFNLQQFSLPRGSSFQVWPLFSQFFELLSEIDQIHQIWPQSTGACVQTVF